MGSLIRTCSDVYKNKDIVSVKNIFGINNYVGTSSDNIVITGFDMTNGKHLVKIKNKSTGEDHALYDTVRGSLKELNISKSSEYSLSAGLQSFNAKGFELDGYKNVNNYNDQYVVTTIKKTEKFFDIVEYTGDGTTNRIINHSLNCDIGMIYIKALDIYQDWIVRHKDAIGELNLNDSSAQTNNFTNIIDINNSYFKISDKVNLLGIKYIAYIFAHDSSYNGKIQCGSYIGGTNTITNTVTGAGKILIPEDVNTITVICKGGTGGNNIWYDPGQPYIAEVKEQLYVAPVYGWEYFDDYSLTRTNPITSEVWNTYNHTKPLAPVVQPTRPSDLNDPTSVVYVGWWTGTKEEPIFWSGHYSAYLITEEQAYVAPNPGQPYKAPSSGGGIFTGDFSTFILNEENYSFEGGNGGPAMPETRVIDLTNSKNKILSYNIAKGGSLVYSYVIGGYTDVTLNYSLPPIKYSTNLVGIGSIVIPTDITKVSIVCSGGVGTNDAWTDPGQPYIAPTPALDQLGLPQYPNGLPPYVKAVAPVNGQGSRAYPDGLPRYVKAVAPVAPVAQIGLPEHKYGLPPYVKGTAGTTGTPEKIIPAGWLYADWANYASTYWDLVKVYAEEVANETEDFVLLTDANNKTYKIYAHQPPGSNYYFVDPVTGLDTTEIAGQVSPTSPRSWTRRWIPSGGGVGQSTINHKWRNAVTIPAIPGTSGTPDVGLPEYKNGLPIYVAPVLGVAEVIGQGNAAYPDGLPYYIETVIEVIGQGKAIYPEGLEPFVAAKPATPGQLYKPPTSGGGDHLGEPSTIFLYDKTFSFSGSYGINPAVVYNENVLLNGNTSQTLEYIVPTSGSLNISYDIPNFDNTLESTFEPFYLIIKKLTNNGEWYEIDCRDKDFHLKLNAIDPSIGSDIIDIKKNGFILKSSLINELNQHYAYVVIRK